MNFIDLLNKHGISNKQLHSLDDCVGLISNIPLKTFSKKEVGKRDIIEKKFGGLTKKKIGEEPIIKNYSKNALMKDLSTITSKEPALGFSFATNDNVSDSLRRGGEGLSGAMVADYETMNKIHNYIRKNPLKFKDFIRGVFPNPNRPDFFIKTPFKKMHLFFHDANKNKIKKIK